MLHWLVLLENAYKLTDELSLSQFLGRHEKLGAESRKSNFLFNNIGYMSGRKLHPKKSGISSHGSEKLPAPREGKGRESKHLDNGSLNSVISFTG